MLHRPTLKERYQALAVEGQGVVLLSEDDDRILRGPLYEQVVPLLDGSNTTDEIVERLERERLPAEVFFALLQLEEQGYLTESAGTPAAVDELDLALPVVDAAAGPTLVLTDSYLRSELAEVNARALRTGRPWLLARPVGTVLWIGPLMRPGVTCCWRCLEHRLRRNRPFEYHLLHRAGGTRPLSRPGASHAAIRAAMAALAGEPADDLTGTLVTLDIRDGSRRRERVERRPQCPACGDPALYTRQASLPYVPSSQRKRFTDDGGHRAVPPEETVATYRRLVGPLTGVVHDVREGDGDRQGPFQICVARYGADPERGDLPLLDRGLRQASGKGMTPAQAVASGLGEAIERYSCVFQGDEPRRTASFEELGAAAIHPNLCTQFSDNQYAERESRNRRSSRWQWIPRPLDPAERLAWTPVWSLTTGTRRHLPTTFLYSGCPAAGDDACCGFDPSGNAAGNSREEAVLQGLMELIERDSLAIWWYNRIARPAVDLDAVDEPWCRRLVECYRSIGRELWVLDITTDLGVPCFAAVSRRTGADSDAILLGFGAHLDARIALTRSLTEMNQILVHVGEAERAGKTLDATLARWLGEASLENQPYLAPGQHPRTRLDRFPRVAADDLADDIRWCAGMLARHGLEPFVLDQTRPDIGVPAVKVIVPGLRHFRARFAPGRLYSVPAALGWLAGPRAESELNPIAFFF